MSNVIAGQTILWGGSPEFRLARVIRKDGIYIKDFTYEELLKGTVYFEKWIDANLFNIEGIEKCGKDEITYWVS